MKTITQIAFVNYKAFYGAGEQNKISIPFKKNVLIYGENGSGKSSVFEGLRQFFNSANNTVAEVPSRHIRVPKTFTDNTDPENPVEKQTEVAVKIQFTDDSGATEEKIFGIPNETVSGTKYISDANLLNSFLSYRELLRTYLMDDLKDRYLFRKIFATLMVENILGKNKNSATQRSYKEDWDQMFLPRIWYKEEMLDKFLIGLNHDIFRINILLNDILGFFENGLEIQLVNHVAYIEYGHSEKAGKIQKYPELEIDINVKLHGEEIEIDEENHLTVLNEARLSSLALSIYLAALILTPQDNLGCKILFLDDVFIGLDTSNRLPLLEILNSYRKPKFEEELDVAGNVNTKLAVIENEIDREIDLFFKDYQIFITTYDRNWFEVTRQFFEHRAKGQWFCVEMFVDSISNSFNVPYITPLNSKIKKAEEYLHRHDYRACAVYLRTACEEELKRILPVKYKNITDRNQQGNFVTRFADLHEMITNLEIFCTEEAIDFEPFINLKVYKNHLLNTLSHNDVHSPIYKRELLDTLESTNYLYSIKVQQLPSRIHDLSFVTLDGNGYKVSARIRKRDTIILYTVAGKQNFSSNCSVELESIEVNGQVTEYNKSYNSLSGLYDEVAQIHNIQNKPELTQILCKRPRNGEQPVRIIDLLET